jgi:hypothetical protein
MGVLRQKSWETGKMPHPFVQDPTEFTSRCVIQPIHLRVISHARIRFLTSLSYVVG